MIGKWNHVIGHGTPMQFQNRNKVYSFRCSGGMSVLAQLLLALTDTLGTVKSTKRIGHLVFGGALKREPSQAVVEHGAHDLHDGPSYGRNGPSLCQVTEDLHPRSPDLGNENPTPVWCGVGRAQLRFQLLSPDMKKGPSSVMRPWVEGTAPPLRIMPQKCACGQRSRAVPMSVVMANMPEGQKRNYSSSYTSCCSHLVRNCARSWSRPSGVAGIGSSLKMQPSIVARSR